MFFKIDNNSRKLVAKYVLPGTSITLNNYYQIEKPNAKSSLIHLSYIMQ